MIRNTTRHLNANITTATSATRHLPLTRAAAQRRARIGGRSAAEGRRVGAANHDGAARHLDRVLSETLQVLDAMTPEQIREDRYPRFRGLGSFIA